MARNDNQRRKAEYLLKQGQSLGKVSKELNIPRSTLQGWRDELEPAEVKNMRTRNAWGELHRYEREQEESADRLTELANNLFFACEQLIDDIKPKRTDNSEKSALAASASDTADISLLSPRHVVPYLKEYVNLINASRECRRTSIACKEALELGLELYYSPHAVQQGQIRHRHSKNTTL